MTAATEPFDPYHVWLGIPPHEQPADHYRLLGVGRFESDADVIASAADRQMTHLRTFQSGKRSALSQKLLNEVAAAKVCLLSPARKAAYDAALRGDAATTTTQTVEPACVFSAIQSDVAPRRIAAKRSSPSLIVAAAACVVIVAVAVVVWANARATPGDSSAAAVVERSATHAPALRQPSIPAKSTPKPVEPERVLPQDSGMAPPVIEPAVSLPTKSDEPASPPEAGLPPIFELPRAEVHADSLTTPATPAAAEPIERHAVPSEAEQRRMTAELQTAFPLAKAKTPADKQRLAGEVLAEAKRAADRADEGYVLLRVAMDTAKDAGDVRIALDALRQLAAGYAIDAPAEERRVLLHLAGTVNQADGFTALMSASASAIDGALAAGDFDAAVELAIAAQRACQRSAGKEFRKEAAQRRTRVQAICDAERLATEAKATLQTRPDDAEAHLTLGRFCCFTLGDWPQGLSHLARGSDAALKSLAERELAGALDTADQQTKLADAWWELAQSRDGIERDAILLHAGTWYQKALVAADSSLARLKIEKRLDELVAIRHRHSAATARRLKTDRPSVWTDAG